MKKEQIDQGVRFGSYRLDVAKVQLWRGTHAVKLTGKAFAVLRYFVDHPGQLVTKDDLFAAVWPETVVTESTLASCIQELRQALRDDARKPRYLETVHRRGYRFIAPLTTVPPVVSSQHSIGSSHSSLPTPNPQPLAPTLVGRETELAQLHGWLAKALNGERQLVFVTGEAGIGKTSLVEAFLAQIGAKDWGQGVEEEKQKAKGKKQKAKVEDPTPNPQSPTPSPWIGRGQCIEHYGSGEAYLPVLAALGQLCREPGHERLPKVLHRYAPTWLMQLPALVEADELETLQRKTAGATRERMLREMAEALEALTAEQPLILVLEDLQWSDTSTLELLAFLARRRQPARLLVLGDYRPVEMLVDGHPLKRVTQELFAHSLGTELGLRLLAEGEVATYLHERFPHSALPTRLAQVFYQRTEGNPFFLVSLVQELMTRGVLMPRNGVWVLQGEVEQIGNETPRTVRQLMTRQHERLVAEEQRILEAASLAGMEFSAATVSAALVAGILQDIEALRRSELP